MYPTCRQTFIKWLKQNPKYEICYLHLGKPKPFDVTLRDGLQNVTELSTINKLTIYSQIKKLHEPIGMEIGSMSSPKLFPIFTDSSTLFNYVSYKDEINDLDNQTIYILFPNEKQLVANIDKFTNLRHFSLITSVSDAFQLKNTKMSLDTTFKQLLNIKTFLNDKYGENNYKLKLYVSCIDECPINGKIELNDIINTLNKLQKMIQPNILCLSDTCGSLTSEKLEQIITHIKPNMNMNNISLHLHVRPHNELGVENVIHTALKNGINNFDTSFISTGGCSVTIEEDKLAPNLSYDLYYKSLCNYIVTNMDKIINN